MGIERVAIAAPALVIALPTRGLAQEKSASKPRLVQPKRTHGKCIGVLCALCAL